MVKAGVSSAPLSAAVSCACAVELQPRVPANGPVVHEAAAPAGLGASASAASPVVSARVLLPVHAAAAANGAAATVMVGPGRRWPRWS